jgi:predicted small integral membrane protein
METVILAGQAAMVGLLAGWIALGAVENIRAPSVNRVFVGEVMAMTRLRQVPDVWRAVSGNRVENPAIHRAAFALIVVVEVIVAVLLGIGTVALALAALGWAAPETARIWAAIGVIGWTGIWGCFLLGGNWFHYWIGSEWAQNTHFLMTIWGVATFIALT